MENKEHLNPANRDAAYSLCLNSDVCTEIKKSDENGGVRAFCGKWKAEFKVQSNFNGSCCLNAASVCPII